MTQQHRAPKLIWDAQDAATFIMRHTAGKTFSDDEQDEFLRSGIERWFITVGEALNQLR